MAFILGALTFFSTMLGGFLALRLKDKLHLVLAFASGAVVATALFEILPEIISQAAQLNINLNTLLLFSALGFLLFHTLERILVFQNCRDPKHREEGCQHVGILSASGFSIHSFFDGLGIGLGFLTNFQLGLVIALAVLAHDFSDGLNTATVIIKNRGSHRQAFVWLLLDALMPLLGVAVSQLLPAARIIIPFVLAFYFGFFLYLGASDLLPEAHHRHSSYLTLLATFLGFSFVYLLVSLIR